MVSVLQACCNSLPEAYYEVVRETHEKGGFGSIGYGCNFKREEVPPSVIIVIPHPLTLTYSLNMTLNIQATKNLLRTHTTAISAQMLHRLANQPGGFTPKKYFSIDR
jgi:phenylalanyl-tRNA synthetase alpha chain